MRILVDADACPVKGIVVKVAREHGVEVTMVCDTSHIIEDGYSQIVIVDKGKDSVDMALINRLKQGDIVVTQDYGVATMALARHCRAISQNGLIYDDGNIDKLLFQRYVSAKIRRGGGRTTAIKKRTREDDVRFEQSLRKLLAASEAES